MGFKTDTKINVVSDHISLEDLKNLPKLADVPNVKVNKKYLINSLEVDKNDFVKELLQVMYSHVKYEFAYKEDFDLLMTNFGRRNTTMRIRGKEFTSCIYIDKEERVIVPNCIMNDNDGLYKSDRASMILVLWTGIAFLVGITQIIFLILNYFNVIKWSELALWSPVFVLYTMIIGGMFVCLIDSIIKDVSDIKNSNYMIKDNNRKKK